MKELMNDILQPVGFTLVFALVALLVACQTTPEYPPLVENTSELRNESLKPFYHGVASGDPRAESVVLWTRVSPETMQPEVEVNWEISTDPDFKNIVASGKFITGPERDYTVKVTPTSLYPGENYYYRFRALDAGSVVGKTKTTPVDNKDGSLKFAVASCSNYEFGYFNAYAAIAEEGSLDAVIHLGDYIYEYGTGVYGDSTVERTNIPPYEIISLQDYRDRYSQYRLDEDLQAAHRNHPFITIWDDHEIANNSYVGGAQNHQEDEGDYITRREAARKAYYEWLPIREEEPHYRAFSYGEIADLIMLDERLSGRTKPVSGMNDPAISEEGHSILGRTQMDWFEDQLTSSGSRWKIIGNQVIFSYLNWGFPTFGMNMDSWDGYPSDQQKIADIIKSKQIQNVVFITGDTHSSWAFEATNTPFDDYDPETGDGAIAVEFGTTSINSANSNESMPTDSVRMHEAMISNSPLNPHLKYTNMRDHGYLLLSVNQNEAVAEFKIVETLKERNNQTQVDQRVKVNSGSNKLTIFEQ